MINLNTNTVLYRPVKQVFEFVSTPENDFQWQYGTLASSRIYGNAHAIGTFFRSIGHLLGERVQGTFEVTEFELNKRYGFKSLSGLLHSKTSYTFKIANGSTQMAVSTQANVGKSSKIDERILEKKMKRQLKENLKMLKDLLEE